MLKAPFPYFGGKSKVASQIWRILGQPEHYMEPFFGSGAVLLGRPDWEKIIDSNKYSETVNDKCGFIANVWRAMRFNPDEVAKWCDWPVNHADLMARRMYLIKHENYLINNLVSDPKWHDAELAGYWIWGISCWIGSGFTVGNSNQSPHISRKGMGVHGRNLGNWFNILSKRLRKVRVVCGDWDRICGGNWHTAAWKNVGIFFDPPYAVENRVDLYNQESKTVAHDVRKWCIKFGKNKKYKIVLAGYDEHQELINDHGWQVISWAAQGGYGNHGNGQGRTNKKREMLYLSPGCNFKTQKQLQIFM